MSIGQLKSDYRNAAVAAPQQYIFSRSTKQSASTKLGITGVPAYVVMPQGTKRGVYVTSAEPNGFWRSIGLRPGSVLVSLDNRVVESPSGIDSVLSSKATSVVAYTYIKMVGGRPQEVSGKSLYSGQSSSGGGGYTSGPSSASSYVSDRTSIGELESHMTKLINRDRAANGGLSALSESSKLSQLARSYAEYMLKKGSFGHVDPDGRDPNDRAKQNGITCGVAENLAFQSRIRLDKESVERAQEHFMNEPPNQQNHRGNILSPQAQYVGVGIAKNDKTVMMVQEFTNVSP